ncbi:class II fructose-bisphosphate aldolase [Labedella populi]|uniref:Class II fructose-bisphosphate aldolase n=1 Tax=Labedella populi TaxID=2498850 RepID=A0A3S3ZLW9_9MICO|nr:class II fructose-bisphosphate aldolase [Labedella populi]RWZ58315.1 class II fructose-bisphosphate aldolase [Labedella populi]
MTVATTADLVAGARATGRGVAALNVIQLEHAQAIVTAAERCAAPVILQVSENAVRYHGGDVAPLAAACLALAERSEAEVSLHLDHATSLELCRTAAAAGFSSFMIDASALDDDENTRVTREAALWGHENGLWVEAELGEVGGKGAHVADARTDPADAADFVAATGVDGLAIAIGSSHAMVTQSAALDLELLRRIRSAVSVPLVLHGTSGVPDALVAEAVVSGITKVNVSTQLNRVMTDAIRSLLSDEPDVVDPRRYLRAARAAVEQQAAHLISLISRPTAAVAAGTPSRLKGTPS